MDKKCFFIKNYDVPEFWPHIHELIKTVLMKTRWIERYPIEALYADLVNDIHRCVVVSDGVNINAVAILEKNTYPLGVSLNVFLLSGDDMSEWATLLHKYLVEYARNNDIKWIDACSRFGLGKKYLERHGFVADNIHYTFEVKNG